MATVTVGVGAARHRFSGQPRITVPRIAFLVGTIGVLLLGARPSHALPAETQMKALGLIVTQEKTGTGFHVGKGCWITAKHLTNAPPFQLIIFDGSFRNAAVVKNHPSKDAALLKGPTVPYTLPFSRVVPKPGDEVWAIGFPGDARDYGQVIPLFGQVHPKTGEEGFLWIKGMAFPGHSGSPVLDKNNRVLGVLVAVHHEQLDVTVAVPTAVLLEVIGGSCR